MPVTIHFRVPPATGTDPEVVAAADEASSDSDESEDQNWDDWVSDPELRTCQSLFDNKQFASVDEALTYDKAEHGFDLYDTYSRLSLDFHQRIRLVNYIRKNKPSPGAIASLDGTEAFFSSDEYLRPVLADDPLLLAQPDDGSDSDSNVGESADLRRIRALEKKLQDSKKEMSDYRAFVSDILKGSKLAEALGDPNTVLPTLPSTRDDSSYFQSYEERDIHAVMIQDKVRTSSYASFILTNPYLFRDAVVLDVGCGTGILSLFAARGGAKRVFAVDASDIAEKAAKIVKVNSLDDVITVIHGKVEDITLPDGISKVDIIVSEWMGYALLYESMLDSVLIARDRFLRPGGVMAPSQCKIMLALCDASEILKERKDFWHDIYGFDLSVMVDDVYDEAVVDVLSPSAMLSEPYVIKDFHLGTITPRQIDFSSPFTITSTATRRTKLSAFVLYFDTFFTMTGEPVSPDTQVQEIKNDDITVAEVWPVGGKAPPQRRKSSQSGGSNKVTSFSTGPRSIPTHWKQTVFLLREPVLVEEGTVVTGLFNCRKNDTNSRELEVEILYSVRHSAEVDGVNDMMMQIYKVR